ncbi:MAG TPA: methylmalonyl-CoA epimerase [Kineosporiaceae bacterium]|nr:methylmalonyl-CoA epimerase [Kineosporiaceae bacterium]
MTTTGAGPPGERGAPDDGGTRADQGPGDDHTPPPDAGVALPPGLVTAIDHVGVAVPDYDAAVEFYRRVFGMRLVHEEVNEDQGVREAMMAVGRSGSCVQILAPLSPQSTIAKFLDRSGPGLQQVAYRVEDVDAVSAALRQRGVRLLYETPRRGTAGSRINFVHPKDAGGVLVELVEPART